MEIKKNTNDYERVMEQVSIVDEISNYMEVNGHNKCVCPFHSDTNPSMSISEERKMFKCFVCGEGGSIITFVAKFEKISNKAALEKLAKKHNIPLTNKRNNNVYSSKEHKVLLDINKYYVTALHNTTEGSHALEYLINTRKLNLDTIKEFRIGLSNQSQNKLKNYLELKMEKEKKYSDQNIENVNQFNKFDQDIFKSRITIPITSNGNVIGFTGRTLDPNNTVKYLNSKTTETFQKNKVVFNLDKALHLSCDQTVIITEGHFDVIRAYQEGVKNVIATMGTSLTQNHIQKLKTANIKFVYLAMDNDEAGIQATLKISKELEKNGIQCKVIEFPKGIKDLDEYFNKYSLEDFNSLKKIALPSNQFLQLKSDSEKGMIQIIGSKGDLNKLIQLARKEGISIEYIK